MGSIAETNSNIAKPKVKSPAAFAHVILRTPNLQPMVDFYLTFLGGRVSFGSETTSFITYDEEHHRIALLQYPETPKPQHSSHSLEHLAFSYNTLEDLLESYRQRKANGMTPCWCVDHGPTTSLYYKDPDGNMCEIYVDNFDTLDETNAFLQTQEFAENPFGADIDPEDWIEKLKNGETHAHLTKREEIGLRGPPDFDSM